MPVTVGLAVVPVGVEVAIGEVVAVGTAVAVGEVPAVVKTLLTLLLAAEAVNFALVGSHDGAVWPLEQ